MKRKIVWLGISWLIVAALVLASCVPSPSGEEEEEEEEGVPIHKFGETYQTSKVAVTISEPIITDSLEYTDETTGKMSTLEANPGEVFFIFTAEIRNLSDSWFSLRDCRISGVISISPRINLIFDCLGVALFVVFIASL